MVDAGDLPEGWAMGKVVDLIESFQPGFASGEKNVEGGVKHLRMNNIGVTGDLFLELVRTVPEKLASLRHELREGDVLVCTTNSGKLVGKCGLFNLSGRYMFSNHLTRLRPLSESVDGSYLRWAIWLHWQRGQFESYCKHWVNQSTIPKEVLLDVELPLPPLAEQRRIVGKLEAVLGKVSASRERLARVPGLLKRFRQSVLAAACSGKLTADWREGNDSDETGSQLLLQIKHKRMCRQRSKKDVVQIETAFGSEIQEVLEEELGFDDLPESWRTCRIGAIGNVCNGSTPSRQEPAFWDGEIPWVSSGEVRNCVITKTRERITADGFERSSVRMLPKGSVLVAMIGEGKTRGQSAILEIEATINQNIAAVDISHGLINSVFLWRWFQMRYSATREEGNGSGPQALNCQRVRELPFLLPPLAEQHEIVRRVERLFALADRLEAQLRAAQTRVDKLTQAVLAKAFRGELVPTEADLARREARPYEPAHELLARIREQQTTTPPAKAPRKSQKKKA